MALTSADLAMLGPQAQKQVLDKLAGTQKPKKSKYGNRFTPRVMPNGKVHEFKSAKEARRYDELALMERQGLIRNLQIERSFTLQETYICSDGSRVKPERYFADFVYERPTAPDCNGQVYWLQEVEDVKGKRTQMYLRKKNEMLAKYGITIREV